MIVQAAAITNPNIDDMIFMIIVQFGNILMIKDNQAALSRLTIDL